jgi:hypothetical protein
MSALTSIRAKLTENPLGLTREDLIEKIPFEEPRDIDLALAQLKQHDQIVQYSGKYILKAMIGKSTTVSPNHGLHTEKSESFQIEKSHLSTAARVTNYLRDEAGKDAERWIPVTEINRICSDGTKQGNQRVSVALYTLKGQSKIESKKTERGFYRWKSAEKTGQVHVPVLDVLKEEELPAAETPPVPAPAEQRTQESRTIQSLLESLGDKEEKATKEFIEKCREYIESGSDDARVACARAEGRLTALQELAEELGKLETA